MKKVRMMAGWVVLGMVLAMAGCGKEEAGASAATQPTTQPGKVRMSKVTLALNWVPEPEFGGFYAARDSGAYRRAGLNVEIEGGGAGTPVIQRVAAGQVQFGIASADEVILARAKKADVIAVFAVYQTCPQGIMVHESRGLKSLGDLFAAGGTLAIEPGLAYANYLKAKYNFDKMTIVPYDGSVAKFLTDANYAQQCFVTSEPVTAARQGAKPQVFLIAESGYNPYTAVVVTRRKLYQQKPEVVKAFVRATREGWASYLENPIPANAVMTQLNRAMEPQAFAAAAKAQEKLIQTEETKAGGLGTMTAQRWQELGEQLVKLGLVKKAPAAAECFVEVD